MPEESRGHAHLLCGGTMGGMRRAGTHMLAEHLGRHQQRRVSLNIRTLDRVDTIRSPDAVGHFQNAGIHTPATRGTAFDFQTRVRIFQITEDTVDGKRLLMHSWSAGARRDGFGDVFVVIPLDVIHTQLANQLVHSGVDIGVSVRVAQIEHLLKTPLHGQAVCCGLQYPIWVSTVDIGIGIDHLRLEP